MNVFRPVAVAIIAVTCFGIAGCSPKNIRADHCAPSRDKATIRKLAMEELRKRRPDTPPQWRSIDHESVISFDTMVSYIATFKEPPIGLVELWFGCDGTPGRVRVDEWGELSLAPQQRPNSSFKPTPLRGAP